MQQCSRLGERATGSKASGPGFDAGTQVLAQAFGLVAVTAGEVGSHPAGQASPVTSVAETDDGYQQNREYIRSLMPQFSGCQRRAGVAELADATDLGSVDRRSWRFESSRRHQLLASATGPWPSGKAPPLHGGDRRFESDRVHLLRFAQSYKSPDTFLRA